MKQYEVIVKSTDVHKVYIEAEDDMDNTDIEILAMQKLSDEPDECEYIREDVDIIIDNVYDD